MFRLATDAARRDFTRAYGHLAYTRLLAWLQRLDRDRASRRRIHPGRSATRPSTLGAASGGELTNLCEQEPGSTLYLAKVQKEPGCRRSRQRGFGLFDQSAEGWRLARAPSTSTSRACRDRHRGREILRRRQRPRGRQSGHQDDAKAAIDKGLNPDYRGGSCGRWAGPATGGRTAPKKRRETTWSDRSTPCCMISNPTGAVLKNIARQQRRRSRWTEPAQRLAREFRAPAVTPTTRSRSRARAVFSGTRSGCERSAGPPRVRRALSGRVAAARSAGRQAWMMVLSAGARPSIKSRQAAGAARRARSAR